MNLLDDPGVSWRCKQERCDECWACNCPCHEDEEE